MGNGIKVDVIRVTTRRSIHADTGSVFFFFLVLVQTDFKSLHAVVHTDQKEGLQCDS